MIEAVVFDLDGVLIDSEPVWEQVRHGSRYLSDELGVDLPPEQVGSVVVERMAARYAQQVPVLPGATDALRRIARRWPVALASSSPRALIDAVLAPAGWSMLFSVTVSTEEVGRGKPAPDVYLAAASRLGVAARSCVAIEDSTNGLRSAAAAGLHLVAIPQTSGPQVTTPCAARRCWAASPNCTPAFSKRSSSSFGYRRGGGSEQSLGRGHGSRRSDASASTGCFTPEKTS